MICMVCRLPLSKRFNLVKGIRRISKALKGDSEKKILPEEINVAKKLRANLKL